INSGQSSMLSWTTMNATSATLNNGFGSVNPAGGSTGVSPVATTTYTLTVSNTAGNNQCSTQVTVNPTTPLFTIKDLGTLGGTYSQPTSINKSGQVTGSSSNSSGVQRAFFWDGTTMSDIGDLGGGQAAGYGINNLGHITGISRLLCTQYCPDQVF